MASTYLSRTFGTATDRKKWTLSVWVKRSGFGGAILSSYADATTTWYSRFADNGSTGFDLTEYNSSSYVINMRPNNLLRDVNGWYHIVLRYDSAQATSTDRVKYWINGEEVTSWSSSGYPTQNQESGINKNQLHTIGKNLVNPDGQYYDGSMSHFHFCDGYAYSASDFGETDANGVWKPKTAPSVTYGNNGFFLKMENSGSMGLDSSGNGNNFTVNGTLTQTIDSPSNVYCTMNPLDNYYFGGTFSNGNNTVLSGSSAYSYCSSTMHVSKGKWYSEVKGISVASAMRLGIGSKIATSASDNLGNDTDGEAVLYPSGNIKVDNVDNPNSWSGTSWTDNDIIGIALDCDNSKLYFSKNGTWMNSANPSAGTGGISITAPASTSSGNYFIAWGDNWSAGTATMSHNFGNGYFGTTAVASAGSNGNGSIFEYDVPTGFYALNTKNLATYG